MNTIKSVLLSSRFKSFYWRTSMMALAGFLALLANNIGDFGIPTEMAVIMGLIFGEISKEISNRYGNNK